ncbi:PWWP domain-containing protein 2A-like [Brienomyrus brachyistius]|uniref:PWWP domain-containing protein 2A-like n=1 Tax=Brienomyrus brachyistius TaxID=42636 RepID=UPI0020B452D8|nr:PWWP domain-containing protein 2A-like [Brienomyrus brachyistius]
MAAVAAEPRAAGAPSAVGDGSELEPEPAAQSIEAEAGRAEERTSVTGAAALVEDGDAAWECPAGSEKRDRPDSEAAGKARTTLPGHVGTGYPGESESEAAPTCHGLTEPGRDGGNLTAEFLPSAKAPGEVSPGEPRSCFQPAFRAGAEPPAVSLHSHPAHPPVMETGPAETVTVGSVLPEPDATEPGAIEREGATTGLWLETGPGSRLLQDAAPKCPHPSDRSESQSVVEQTDNLESTEAEKDIIAEDMERCPAYPCDALAGRDCAASGLADAHLQSRTPDEPAECDVKPAVPCAASITQLIPGSEVRVSLDHIIDDALVVSFQLGEKLFSGVLMDLSKRFGPYGIPVTVFPKREHRDKSESMQLRNESFQPETEKSEDQDFPASPKEPDQSPALSDPTPSLWTSKPPPLFQEGVPYPPPLFIRDTYNQSIPQPPPRKIKRPKRRLYREEPTSIMNAIKLRPRQVLCDKCKGAVVGDKRELRRGPGADYRGEDAKRRKNEGPLSKRPRSEDRGRGADGSKRHAPAVGQAKTGKVVKTTTTTAAANNSRVQLSAKKVLQSKNVDHSKAREVLKMAKAQRQQRDTVGGDAEAKTTRASSLRDAHQKVHFTRRGVGGGGGGGPRRTNPLPPRIRIKPQSTATLKGC